MTKGVKYDSEKNRYDLIPADALDEIVKNLTYGSKKYSDENWRLVDNPEKRYFAAAQRHLWAWKRGEKIDPENGISNLAAAAVNVMFILDLEIANNKSLEKDCN